MASASALADALIVTLKAQSASTFNNNNLTKNDFGLLDTTTSGCVFMILPAGFESLLESFGNPAIQHPLYRLTVRVFVRDTGNSTQTLNRIWQAEKDLRTTIGADDTLGGSAITAVLRNSDGWNGDLFVEVNGHVWLPQNFTLEAVQND